MIKVKQTIMHDPPNQNGNCFAAVISTITGIPIQDVLPVHQMYDLPYWDIRLLYWLMERGFIWRNGNEFKMVFNDGNIPNWFPYKNVKDKLYIVSGKTTRFDGQVNHCCIYMNGELWHDPHPDGTGLTTQEYFEVIEPLKIK